jgi:hypothetical protein
MPVRYSKQIEKTGAAVGSVISIVRPSTYTTSTTESVEASRWNITGNYPGWLECDGRTLNVSDYRALYSVIGNTYGGTSGVTFKLPDYRSKKICGTGALNGNSGSSLSLSPTTSPTGIAGGGSEIAGSVGGYYSINTIRQLPENSEVTPINPSNPPTIGGNAIDTFSLGTFRSQGFSNVTDTVEPVLFGNVSFGIGPTSNVSVSAVPPHFHFLVSVAAGTQKACVAPKAPVGPSYNFFEDAAGTIRSFNRARRPWPGAGTGGGLSGGGEPATLGLSLSGTALDSYVPITFDTNNEPIPRETGGFYEDGGPGTTDTGLYLAFGSKSFGSLQSNRRATWTTNAVGAENLVITAIAGNDRNGGERVNTAGESLRVFFNGVDQGIILPSRADSGLQGEAYDSEYDTWKEREFPIPSQYRVSNLQISFRQTVVNSGSEQGEPPGGPDEFDMFGIERIELRGNIGEGYVYDAETDPIPLQRHSHMIFWDEPNTGDTVPGVVSTFGTGGGADLDYFTNAPNGLRTGGTASTTVSTNNSIGLTISKTVSITEDIANGIRPATVKLSDTSRVTFDNSISVRLEAAEEIVLISPYFRSKYLIKAY